MYKEIAEYSKAYELFSRVLERLPNDLNVWLQRGSVQQERGRHRDAISDFSTAISINEKSHDAWYLRGISKLKTKAVKEAINDLMKADEKDVEEQTPSIHDGLGRCYHQQRDYTKALERFEMALKKEPKNVEFLSHRADLNYDEGNYDLAIEDL